MEHTIVGLIRNVAEQLGPVGGAAVDLLLAGAVMGRGYALWNIGIIGGNMVLLATLPYFTSLLSTFFQH